jgi:hypothetical protein
MDGTTRNMKYSAAQALQKRLKALLYYIVPLHKLDEHDKPSKMRERLEQEDLSKWKIQDPGIRALFVPYATLNNIGKIMYCCKS